MRIFVKLVYFFFDVLRLNFFLSFWFLLLLYELRIELNVKT